MRSQLLAISAFSSSWFSSETLSNQDMTKKLAQWTVKENDLRWPLCRGLGGCWPARSGWLTDASVSWANLRSKKQKEKKSWVWSVNNNQNNKNQVSKNHFNSLKHNSKKIKVLLFIAKYFSPRGHGAAKFANFTINNNKSIAAASIATNYYTKIPAKKTNVKIILVAN